jgi:AcrR family transcriptional regulator
MLAGTVCDVQDAATPGTTPATRSDGSRAALLDAAERLFAEHGIAGVSDRKIAQAAGQRNHSAVAYHFGGRDGLLGELVDRHTWSLEEDRTRCFAESTTLLGDVRSLVLPLTGALGRLPAPSWRARFLARALTHQHAGALLRRRLDQTPMSRAIGRSILARIDHLDPAVTAGRISLMGQVVVTSCADMERSAAQGEPARWAAVGTFLADALTGMLSAPSTLVAGAMPPVRRDPEPREGAVGPSAS